LPRSQAFKSSITEALNFVRDSVEDLLTKRAIVYTIDNSAVTRDARDFSSNLMFMDEDEFERLKDSKESEGKILLDVLNNKIFIFQFFSLILFFTISFSYYFSNIFIYVKCNKLNIVEFFIFS